MLFTRLFKRDRCADYTKSAVVDAPVFIIGVLRSGTTLLRVVLDTHSKLAGASETPWILGGYGDNSIRQLCEFLSSDKYGPVKNLEGITEDTLLESTRSYVQSILTPYLTAKNKNILVLKTPQDIKYIEFLTKLFPYSKFIHIFRDGRDSACSLVDNVSKVFGAIDDYGALNHLNAFKRWYDWELKIRRIFPDDDVRKIRVKYEELVVNPTIVLQEICTFLGIEFEAEMLNYSKHSHTLPKWEAGTHDVKAKKQITVESIGRWRNYFTPEEAKYVEQHYGNFLLKLGYR